MQGSTRSGLSEQPGGRFSLGRLNDGSGYCVGAIVETRMGLGQETDPLKKRGRKSGSSGGNKGVAAGDLAGNGMRDVWVLGGGFFRGVGGVFDVRPLSRSDARIRLADQFCGLQFKEKTVGFRTY